MDKSSIEQIFMFFNCTMSRDIPQMGKILRLYILEIFGHPRVYDIQNDRLDHMISLAEKVWKKMLCSQRYLHFFEDFSLFVLPISLNRENFCPFFLKQELS